MRLLILLVVLFSCKQPAPQLQYKEVVKTDTLYRVDTVYQPGKIIRDTITVYTGDKKTIDSLKTRLFLANYKVERVKYYLKICLKNPSQDKFLKGWIKRAVDL